MSRGQGRQDSNLQPPVLETGALPIAPRPWVAERLYPRARSFPRGRGAYHRGMPIAALFAAITLAFAGIAVWTGAAGEWLLAACAGALAAWMGSLAWAALRKIRP